jgi:catechol 2,3-dioxygenase-like lactoylglutathione lyase family enzyme
MSKNVMTTSSATSAGAGLPFRLHHNAFVVKDQERTRAFYEDVLGMPLMATWIEISGTLTGEVYCHSFYGLADGSALAFFTFSNPEIQKDIYGGGVAKNLYHHIALATDRQTQSAIRERCRAAGLKTRDIDHGYCQSLYLTDPDGLIVEFTVDPPNIDEINAYQARVARASLNAWQSGDRRPNNDWRAHADAANGA